MNYLYLILSLCWTVGVPILLLVWLILLTDVIAKLYKEVKTFRVQLTEDPATWQHGRWTGRNERRRYER